MPADGEVLVKFALQFKKLEDAVTAVVDFLGKDMSFFCFFIFFTSLSFYFFSVFPYFYHSHILPLPLSLSLSLTLLFFRYVARWWYWCPSSLRCSETNAYTSFNRYVLFTRCVYSAVHTRILYTAPTKTEHIYIFSIL